MIDSEGEIIDHELHSPFAYLRSLVDDFSTEKQQECGSEQPLGGAPKSVEPPADFIIQLTKTQIQTNLIAICIFGS